jgi:siroheme synthase-like protein
MRFLPVGLNITAKKVLIIGGGKTAFQKLKAVRQFTRRVAVVGAAVSGEIRLSGVSWKEALYVPGHLEGYSLVYACTDDKKINTLIVKHAHARGILVNVVDDPALCDFISPAVYKKGSMTVAVSSDGKNVRKAVAWRNRTREVLER